MNSEIILKDKNIGRNAKPTVSFLNGGSKSKIKLELIIRTKEDLEASRCSAYKYLIP